MTEGSASLFHCWRDARVLTCWLSLLLGDFSLCPYSGVFFLGKKWILTYHSIFKFYFWKPGSIVQNFKEVQIVEALTRKRSGVLQLPTCRLELSLSLHLPQIQCDWLASDSLQWGGGGSTLYWLWECKASHHEPASCDFWRPQSLSWLEDDSGEAAAALGSLEGQEVWCRVGEHLICPITLVVTWPPPLPSRRLCSAWSSDLIFLYIFVRPPLQCFLSCFNMIVNRHCLLEPQSSPFISCITHLL